MSSDLMIRGTDAPCSVQIQDSAHYFPCSWLRNDNQHRIDCYSSVNFINKMNTSSQNIHTHCKFYFIARPVKYHSEITTEPHSLCSTLSSLAQPVPDCCKITAKFQGHILHHRVHSCMSGKVLQKIGFTNHHHS